MRLKVHLDGARIWNAAVALGVDPAELGAGVDTVRRVSRKAWRARGSLVASTRERIGQARRMRKLLGGGMRQAGVLAAAGLVALETRWRGSRRITRTRGCWARRSREAAA